MYRTTSDHFYKKIGIAKEFRNDVLCFFFHGASKDLVRQTFSRLKDMCSSEVTTENVHGMTNGRCHKNIVVKVTASGTQSIREDELTTMIVHFLQKKQCEVEVFNDFSKFINT